MADHPPNSFDDDGVVPDPLELSSSLDHALLESLFYNELVMAPMESFYHNESMVAPINEDDFNSSDSFPMNFSSLEDFGACVTNSPATTSNTVATTTSSVDPSVVAEKDLLRGFGMTQQSDCGLDSSTEPTQQQQQRKNQLVASRGGIRHNVTAVPVAVRPTPAISEPCFVEEKRTKLVTQFSTLASRLGIQLPPQVLQKLTANASNATQTLPKAPEETIAEASSPESAEPTEITSTSLTTPKFLDIHRTTTDTTESVSQKRPAEDSTATNNGTKYSKRRKKPRMSDCENKLAELQAENALLKRHLENISNAKRVTDNERIASEQRMRRMLETNAPDVELDPVIQSFTELYSDYGRKRHEEINFHLTQLQRLANPTNFTKMGLWTLAGQSRNKETGNDPIAGMLQKELGISSTQGRKILDQRAKIKNVCSNLKECLVLLGRLKVLCETKTKIFHDRMTKCREILTPKQVVKLLIWIDDNSETLACACPGWGSEQFQKKPAGTTSSSI